MKLNFNLVSEKSVLPQVVCLIKLITLLVCSVVILYRTCDFLSDWNSVSRI